MRSATLIVAGNSVIAQKSRARQCICAFRAMPDSDSGVMADSVPAA
jgi:hypothetical protein